MKKLLVAFEPNTYLSGALGVAKSYRHNIDLCEELGQAKTLLVQVVGERTTGGDTRATIAVWHTSSTNQAPSEVGFSVSSTNIETPEQLRPAIITVAGPGDRWDERLMPLSLHLLRPHPQGLNRLARARFWPGLTLRRPSSPPPAALR